MNKSVKNAREEQQALEALHRLDEECVHHQRANDFLRAFDCMERALVLRRHFFGLESEEVALACRALAEMCNLLAMSFLQQDNFPVTVDLLKKAEVLTAQHGGRFAAEHATTLNNLACYYRRLGKLHAAMTSLRSAVAIERRLGRVANAADTLLNLCAVLSQLGKHDQALANAQEALLALQEDVFKPSVASPSLDRVSVMCIAYHNIGVEQEFLKAYDECVQSYKKVRKTLTITVDVVLTRSLPGNQGVGLAEQYLGLEHSVTTTIRNSYLAAKRSLSTKPRGARQSQRPENPYAWSPSKAARQLLSSPRDKSGNPSSPSSLLRMPSPLTKEKQRQNIAQIPTPRFIIADALSRKSLPPLESPKGRDASKKPGGTTAVATPLAPTDPFFSPRYRFPDSEARVEPESTATSSPERNKRASSASRRRSSSNKTASGGRGGNRVRFATAKKEDERPGSKADAESANELAAAEGMDPPDVHMPAAAFIPADEARDEITSGRERVKSLPKSTEADVSVTGASAAIQEGDINIMASAERPAMAMEAAQIAELDEKKATSLSGDHENALLVGPDPPADELSEEPKEEPVHDAPPTEEPEIMMTTDLVEGEGDHAEDGAVNQSDTPSGGDDAEGVVEAATDGITISEAPAESTTPTNANVESVQDDARVEVATSDVEDHGGVAEVEASYGSAAEDNTTAVVDFDLGDPDTDGTALMLESTENEPSLVANDVETSDESGEVIVEVAALVEFPEQGEGERYEMAADDHVDTGEYQCEQQVPDEWPSPQDGGPPTAVQDADAGAEYPAGATGYEDVSDENQLHADDAAVGGQDYHYEYTEAQLTQEAQDHYGEYGDEGERLGVDPSLQYEEPHPTEEHQGPEEDQPTDQAQDPAYYEDAPTLETTSYEAAGHEETDDGSVETTDDAYAATVEADEGGEAPAPSTE